jgi:hypothetical protein
MTRSQRVGGFPASWRSPLTMACRPPSARFVERFRLEMALWCGARASPRSTVTTVLGTVDIAAWGAAGTRVWRLMLRKRCDSDKLLSPTV